MQFGNQILNLFHRSLMCNIYGYGDQTIHKQALRIIQELRKFNAWTSSAQAACI